MNLEFLKEVLSIPSISGDESLVREYIMDFADQHNIDYYVDKKGNIYLTKGIIDENEFYPCVVSHMDTVHRHKQLIEENSRLTINEVVELSGKTKLFATHPVTNKETGIGGDDKCGVYVCLELLLRFDKIKASFFVEEEIGMLGSKVSDNKFFENVGYAIQFDAPSSNWITEVCFGVELFDEEFKTKITESLRNDGYTKFSRDPFTDVNQLASKYDFCCLNLGCGYYSQHSDFEYVLVEEVGDSIIAGENLIRLLGLEKQIHNKKPTSNKNFYPFFDRDDDLFYQDEFDTISDDITKIVISLYNRGYDQDVIKDRVKLLLKINF